MDSVVRFEIPADVIDRAEEFYSRGFGWAIRRIDEYNCKTVTAASAGDNSSPKLGAINGGITKRGTRIENIVVTIKVADIDDKLARIERLGGKTVAPKKPMDDAGFTAYFEDTEGNVVGLWQDAL